MEHSGVDPHPFYPNRSQRAVYSQERRQYGAPYGSMQGGNTATIAYSQLDHLRTHPSVAVLPCQKKVDLHGWAYSISTGDVWVYDCPSGQFTSLLDDAVPRLKVAR